MPSKVRDERNLLFPLSFLAECCRRIKIISGNFVRESTFDALGSNGDVLALLGSFKTPQRHNNEDWGWGGRKSPKSKVQSPMSNVQCSRNVRGTTLDFRPWTLDFLEHLPERRRLYVLKMRCSRRQFVWIAVGIIECPISGRRTID